MDELVATMAIVCTLAFLMGYSINQGGTCAVAAVHEVLHRRRCGRLVGLMAASAAAGLVAAPLAWSGFADANLAATVGIGVTVISGAVVFAIGAIINDACLLGSLGRLGNGEIRFAALPVGLAGGFLAVAAVGFEQHPVGVSILAAPGVVAGLALLGFALILVLALWFLSGRRQSKPSSGQWSPGTAMIVLGLSGGAIYAMAPGWTYADFVQRSLPLPMAVADETAALTVTATVAGAIAAACRRRTWRLRRGTLADIGKTLLGGGLMGFGVGTIPGGNDGLVLAAVPSLSPGGVAAHVTMMLSIMAVLAARLHWQRCRSGKSHLKAQRGLSQPGPAGD
ncbi:YeeE/YedE family protein [Aurantimonas aggregata]|uniref:YeeE/YedE family protein n=1 Tax=Aurantimonas aggregata TaxID=2047720 RepID=A0A6L9MM95_9HYPH|nr:YeeE/YedE thiosulfate transporter family protein [Aurantimonas aggregata]NDV88953.1 YeeE/YedE family protein [Aurantimonas aggregata]